MAPIRTSPRGTLGVPPALRALGVWSHGVKALVRIHDMPYGPFLAGASRLGANKWHLYSLPGPY
ncbi:MAG: hypothetical protein IPP78_09855 [Holophagaceae bacterium]|nr:hypothetical protein [Holophagaceae bacterium]